MRGPQQQVPPAPPTTASKCINSQPQRPQLALAAEKSSDDASSSANPPPVELPLKKSKAGILEYGSTVSAFFEQTLAKPPKPAAAKPTVPGPQHAPAVRTPIREEPMPRAAPAKPPQPQPQPAAAAKSKPQTASNYFVKSKPLLPVAKPKKPQDSESSDDDDSSLDLPANKKPAPQSKQTGTAPAQDSAQPAAGKKVNLNFTALETKKPSLLEGYEELCLESLKELGDADASKLMHEGLRVYYKVLEMDEEGWDLRLSKDYIQGIVVRFGSGILTVDIVKDGRVASSDEMHVDVIYSLLVSRESAKHQELLDRVLKRSKGDEEMREHKEKYKKLAEVDATMSEQEKQISHQVNYYFGDKNYFRDKFILNHVEHDEDKALSLELLLNFNKVKDLSRDLTLIEGALRKFAGSSMCTFCFVDGKKKIYKKSVARQAVLNS